MALTPTSQKDPCCNNAHFPTSEAQGHLPTAREFQRGDRQYCFDCDRNLSRKPELIHLFRNHLKCTSTDFLSSIRSSMV